MHSIEMFFAKIKGEDAVQLSLSELRSDPFWDRRASASAFLQQAARKQRFPVFFFPWIANEFPTIRPVRDS
jgi:hypothetical protein